MYRTASNMFDIPRCNLSFLNPEETVHIGLNTLVEKMNRLIDEINTVNSQDKVKQLIGTIDDTIDYINSNSSLYSSYRNEKEGSRKSAIDSLKSIRSFVVRDYVHSNEDSTYDKRNYCPII